jgi:phage terminase small subunit
MMAAESKVGARLRTVPYQRLPLGPDWLEVPERELWDAVVKDFELGPDGLAMLELACNAIQRWREARSVLDAEGLTQPGRWGDRLHPLVKVEQDSRTAALRALRELDLEGIPLPAPIRRVR